MFGIGEKRMLMSNRKIASCVLILLSGLFGLLSNAMAQTTWSNGHAYRRAITIDHTKVPNSDQSNFPMLISGTYSYLATIANGGDVTSTNGYDIIFTSDAAGTTALAFERESYSATTGAATFWVKIPTLSHTSDTTIYMFYGNGAVTTDQSTPTSVWDSNFAGVWHLGAGSPVSLSDSTANGYNLTNNNSVSATTGKLGGGASFNGSNNYLSNSSLSVSAGSSITISYWNYVTTANLQSAAGFTIGGSEIPNRIQANAPWSDSTLYWDYGSYSSGGRVSNSYGGYLNQWSYVSLVFDSSTNTHAIYLNGALAASNVSSNAPTSAQTGIDIGAWPSSYYEKGSLDEFRVSKSARSADWIATEYNSQNSPSTFLSIGAADSTGSGGTPTPSISSLSPSSGPVTTPVVISGNNFGATQGTSTVTFNGVAATPLSWTGAGILARVPSTATTGNVVVTVGSSASNTATFTVTTAPGIVSISPASGVVGTQVTLTGVNFGTTPGTVALNGTTLATPTWTNSSIVAVIPSGATSGPFVVTVGSQSGTSPNFTVTTIPTGWLNQDVGSANVAGTASYSNNTFTLQGSGYFANGVTSDGFQFAFRTLTGDGSIIARPQSLPNYQYVGIAIRSSLDANAPNAAALMFTDGMNSNDYFSSRLTVGASMVPQTGVQNSSWPVWLKVSRTGNTFTGFYSYDGENWTQLGTSVTITMGSTAYAGLLISGGGGWSLATGTFDDVRVTSTTASGPIISGISATTGSAGESVTVWGSGFGASQLNSNVLVNGVAATVSSWSATSISFTIPTGATTGPVIVVVSPDLLDSNPVKFTITTNPLPSGWDDQDLGSTGGSATYSSGQFTIQGVGGLIQSSGGYTTADSEHFVYQPLTGDGTIIARVVSLTGTNQIAGVMMRDTLDSGAMFASSAYTNGTGAQVALWYRLLTNTNDNEIVCSCSGSLWTPYWVKLTRSGTAFSTFKSPDGVNWQLTAPPQSINMGSTIYVGIFSTQGTAVFDNVSIAPSGSSSPTITSLTSSTGSVGSQIIISGSGFGSTQGNSAVMLNDTPMTVNLWSDTAITFTVVSGATSGPLVVSVAPSMNNSNAIPFTVTTHPLVSGWYDFPVGGAPGDASYSGGVFTVHSNGTGMSGGSDQFHFVYQPLTTDGTIIVRVASLSGASTALQAGVAIRQTLDTSSAESAAFFVNGTPTLTTRTILSGGGSQQTASGISLPYWLKLVRSQNSFAAYSSPDGIGWAQIGTTQTMVSARTVYIGFGVGGGGSAQITATFDNVSVTAGASLSNPIATAISPSSGPAGTAVTVTGTGFGSTTGTIFFNGVPGTVTSWGDTSIGAVVPESATSGPVYVTTGNITTSYGGGGSAEIVFNVVLTAVVTDSLGNQSTYHSSLFGGMFQFTDSTGSGCSTCNVRGTIHNEYDSKGNRLWVINELGHTKYDQFDSSYNLTAETVFPTAATPATTTFTYNSLGQVTTATDALGNKTNNTYDSHGNLTAVSSWSPTGGTLSTTNFGYNSLGQLTTITDPLSNLTTIAYNSVGLISSITDAQSNVTTYGYDSRGNRTSVTDSLSHTTTFTYDNGNRLTQITYPDSTTSSFAYDYRGRRTSVTDQNGKTTNYVYDDADRLLTMTDAASNVTTYGYDTENNLTSVTDANSHETSFTYDAFGRVTQTNFPSSHVENYTYDAVGNLTSKTDRNGNTINYVYDGLNRLTRKLYPDSTEADYVYDLVGRMQQVNDPSGTYQFTYDGMGRLTGTTTNYSFLTSRSFTTGYTYDAASNRTGFIDPEGGSTTYGYDTLNRLSTLTPPSAFATGNFGFGYDALSRRTQMTRPNGVTTNYAYDNLSRLTSILHQLSGSTIDGATYTLDNAGNRTAKTDKRTNVTSNYTYDNIYQLAQVTQGTTTTESYSYDPVGNRTASLGVSSYTTNSSNELTALTGAGFTYDYNGNATSKTVSGSATNYEWDFENRLTMVILPGTGGTVNFKYDPFGRRIYKSSSSGTTIYAYDGENVTEEVSSSGSTLARYSQGLNIDEALAMLRSGTTNYYNEDGIGSIISVTSSSGTLNQTYTFDTFGKQTASSGSLVNSFQYTGREFDAETGIYYYRARYYDPNSGRFLSEDPLGFFTGVNHFSYVSNNPGIYFDPFGLYCKIPWLTRVGLGAKGVFHIYLGSSKIAAGAAATVATEGVAAPLLIYAVPSGVGNLASGIAELSTAIVGDESLIEPMEEINSAATAATTVTGVTTLIRTRGDLDAAERNSQFEGLFTGAFVGGLQGELSPLDKADMADVVHDVTKKKKPKPETDCECSPQ